MYLNLFVTFCVCTFMYRVADSGKRRGWLWGIITLLWVVSVQQLFGDGLMILFAGFLGSFISMTIANFVKDPSSM